MGQRSRLWPRRRSASFVASEGTSLYVERNPENELTHGASAATVPDGKDPRVTGSGQRRMRYAVHDEDIQADEEAAPASDWVACIGE